MPRRTMCRRILTACLVSGLVLFLNAAAQHEAHRHGAAELDVVLEGAALTIALLTPAANVVGFEHAPKSDAESAVLAGAIEALRDGVGMFDLDAQAGCGLESAKVETTEDHDGHGDIEANWRFRCASPENLDAIGVRLFERFGGFEIIEARWIGPVGQSAATLTARENVIAW